MGKEANGIQTFTKDDKLPDLPDGLTDDLPVLSRFGFKIAMIEGKYYWECASEQDYRASEAKRLGINPEDVHIMTCAQTAPRQCTSYYCGNGYYCTLQYNPQGQYYYCGCA